MKIFRNHFFFIILSLSITGTLQAQKKINYCWKTEQLIQFIREFHYQPSQIDEAFTEKVNNTFIAQLDPIGIFFTQKDVNFVEDHCIDLTDIDCSSNKNFMKLIVELYRRRLNTADSLVDVLTNQPFNFNLTDSIYFTDPEKIRYVTNQNAIKTQWDKFLRFLTLRYYFSGYKAEDSTFIKNKENFLQAEPELQDYIRQKEKCKIQHVLNHPAGFEDYIFNLYLNILAGSFDPHTNYFSKNNKEHFDFLLSRNKFSFGVDLDQNKNGDIYIARLVPGGPAWRSNELNKGDILLKIKFPEKESIDLFCSNLHEIEDLIYNSDSEEVELTVHNVHGQVKTIPLKMELMEAAENVIYSFILGGEKKIGYIVLPGFYTEPNQFDPLGCASDLVKEILKLREDKIEGLILDVRNNGGGSMIEAVDLAGVFIDSGPLCIYKNRDEKPTLINDLNRGVIYDGPLVLMVNGFSASASEVLAGILQDYNRAVVVGSFTFGKASGQIILPLGEKKKRKSQNYTFDVDATDFVKVTATRYYNLSGLCHQTEGITPDIPLPAHVGFKKYRESELPNALSQNSIVKDVTYEPFPEIPMDYMISKSKARIQDHENFRQINHLNDLIEPLYNEDISLPLDFESFEKKFVKNITNFQLLDSAMQRTTTAFSILNNTYDEDILKYDSYKREIHKELTDNIKKDIYIEEAFFIINDMIDYENKQ
ncbi:MAG: carboxy terminal-processing peptidase [Bacteroidales bacterium]|nr:carboxy terminal-processing peptidase [Bacteroidales bacterium]